jgi:leucyl-tRNA synthetase
MVPGDLTLGKGDCSWGTGASCWGPGACRMGHGASSMEQGASSMEQGASSMGQGASSMGQGASSMGERGKGNGERGKEQGESKEGSMQNAFRREMHRVVKRVTEDLERFKFNTAVAALMQYLNTLYDYQRAGIDPSLWREALEKFTILLCPIAPFVTEEVWQGVLGHAGHSVHLMKWPEYDEEMIAADEIAIMIQVNGRLRDKVTVPKGISDDELREAVLTRTKIKSYTEGNTVRRVIIVPEKLVNIVVN